MQNQILEKSIQNHQSTPFLDWIDEGLKKYEGRLKTKIQEWSLHPQKLMIFTNNKKSVLVEITSLPTFADFGEAYEKLGSLLIPGKLTKEEVIDLYNGFFHHPDEKLIPGLTSQMIKDHGVVAIGVRPIATTPLANSSLSL